MKRYRDWKIGIVLFYAISAVFLFYAMGGREEGKDTAYRVEINRMYDEITRMMQNNKASRDITYGEIPDEKELERIIEKEGQAVRQISYLPAYGQRKEQIMEFYQARNGMQTEMVPLMAGEVISGYLRFDYQKAPDHQGGLYLAEGFLFLWFLFALILMFYVERKIIIPFQRICRLPLQLAQGDLTGELEESKDRYFGQFTWGLAMLRDELKTRKKQELQLIRDKKMLLLSISHDIKTPLNAVSLYAKALEQGLYVTAKERENVARQIQRKTEEITSFVREIVRSSTEEAVMTEVHNREFYLNELVEKVMQGYAEKCRLWKQRFLVGHYENYLLYGDVDRLYEAMGNLIENAVKYGDGREIRISFAEEDFCVLLSVYNSGATVEERDFAHLFDSFYRGKNAEGKEGYGLGLSICREIMRKMDGDIFAKQAEGGMEFVLVCRMSG